MKKKLVVPAFAFLFATLFVTGVSVSASEIAQEERNFTTVQVEYGASWTYGYNTVIGSAESNLFSSTNVHSSTVCDSGGNCDGSGWIEAGCTSYSKVSAPTRGANFYYNI